MSSTTKISAAKLPKLDKKLISAVKAGNFSLVKSLFKNCKVNVNCLDKNQKTCLHHAIAGGHTNIVRLLIARGINVNPEMSHISPLARAVESKRREAVELLVRAGADVNARYSGIDTPLEFAVKLSDVSLTQLLLDSGAELGSILETAYRNRSSVDVIKIILGRMSTESVAAQFADRLNLLAALGFHDDEEAIKLLIDQPLVWESMSSSMPNGLTLLIFASLLCPTDNPMVVRLLLERGAEINARTTTSSMTALYISLHRGHTNMARELINSGADVNARCPHPMGFFPLYVAAQLRSAQTIELLISKGADLHATTISGETALHNACFHHLEDNIRALLVNGADPLVKDDSGRTAFQLLIDLDSVAARQMVRRLAAIALAEKRQVDDNDMELIAQRPRLLEFYNQCAAEIEQMGETKVYNDLTLLRVQFVISEDRLAKLLRNEDFLASFKSKLLEKRFPLYKEYICARFERAEEKKETHRAIRERLQDIFSSHLPELVIDCLLHYLTVGDLFPESQVLSVNLLCELRAKLLTVSLLKNLRSRSS